MNHVHGLNRICHCEIHIEEEIHHDKNSCIQASVRSSPVLNIILQISSDHDILAKYNHEKLFTSPLLTIFKLFWIHFPDSVCQIEEYIFDQSTQVEYHNASKTFCAFILFQLTVFQLSEASESQLLIIIVLICEDESNGL
jgi:hypothetical protein